MFVPQRHAIFKETERGMLYFAKLASKSTSKQIHLARIDLATFSV